MTRTSQNLEIYLIGLTALLYTSSGMSEGYSYWDIAFGATMFCLVKAIDKPTHKLLRFAYASTLAIAILTATGLVVEIIMHWTVVANYNPKIVDLFDYNFSDHSDPDLYLDDLIWFLLWVVLTGVSFFTKPAPKDKIDTAHVDGE